MNLAEFAEPFLEGFCLIVHDEILVTQQQTPNQPVNLSEMRNVIKVNKIRELSQKTSKLSDIIQKYFHKICLMNRSGCTPKSSSN